MLNSPIKWVGGKSRLRKTIIELIPEHTCYVEVFSGAAWVLFGKASSDVEVINDIDGDLVNFFQVIKSTPEEFITSFDWDLVSREQFEHLASLDPTTLTALERAHRFYYLIMAGWGGELNYPRFQTSIRDGGHGNRLIGALETLRTRILPIHQRLRTVIIEHLDWRDCVDRYDKEGVFMYIDPPYPGNGVNYAHNMRDWTTHYALAERLSYAKCKWLLSSYDNPQIRSMYRENYCLPVKSSSGMRKSKKTTDRVVVDELLIANYDIFNVPLNRIPQEPASQNGDSEQYVQDSLL